MNYERLRNSFIPEACAIADGMVKGKVKTVKREGKDGNPYNHDMWSEHFHDAMNELTRDMGRIA